MRRTTVLAMAISAGMLGSMIAAPGGAQERGEAETEAPVQCQEQTPEPGLIRGNWVVKARMPREEQQRRRLLAEQAIRVRTER